MRLLHRLFDYEFEIESYFSFVYDCLHSDQNFRVPYFFKIKNKLILIVLLNYLIRNDFKLYN